MINNNFNGDDASKGSPRRSLQQVFGSTVCYKRRGRGWNLREMGRFLWREGSIAYRRSYPAFASWPAQ